MAESENPLSDRRDQRQRDRHQKRVEKDAAKEEHQRRSAPERIRGAARGCFIFGVLAVFGGIFESLDTPSFGGDAYTEIVAQLGGISGAVAWLAAVLLFTVCALLRALADILDELRRQTASRATVGAAPPSAAS